MRNIKICVVCGKKFPCPPSSKKITCCRDCSRIQKKKKSYRENKFARKTGKNIGEGKRAGHEKGK